MLSVSWGFLQWGLTIMRDPEYPPPEIVGPPKPNKVAPPPPPPFQWRKPPQSLCRGPGAVSASAAGCCWSCGASGSPSFFPPLFDS